MGKSLPSDVDGPLRKALARVVNRRTGLTRAEKAIERSKKRQQRPLSNRKVKRLLKEGKPVPEDRLEAQEELPSVNGGVAENGNDFPSEESEPEEEATPAKRKKSAKQSKGSAKSRAKENNLPSFAE